MAIRQTLQRLSARARQRGSALLVSLMVMVGLSLLGLAFVALSETESAISINERNHAQTVAVAEAGAKLVVQWFQSPTSMLAKGLMPANESVIKNLRATDPSGGTTAYYRPSGVLFDTPFGPNAADLFMGMETNPDIVINAATLGASSTQQNFLTNLNTTLFGTTANGQITDIRIYAPPVIGATNANNNTYVGGQRFGIATVKVTAQKLNAQNSVIAQSVVRLVLGPFPLPGPTGAIQAVGSIGNGGNFKVHWGPVESEADIGLTKDPIDFTSIPWANAWEQAHIERGYDSSTIWRANTPYVANTFPLGSVVRPTKTALQATPGLSCCEYVATPHANPNSVPQIINSDPTNEPTWVTTLGATVPDGNGAGRIDWIVRPRSMYKIYSNDSTQGTAEYDSTGGESHNWFAEVLGKSVNDPWFQMRSWKTVNGSNVGPHSAGSSAPQPYPYAPYPSASSPPPTSWNGSNWFQYQTFNAYPTYKKVEVPKFDYDVWKAAAIAGRGQPGVHYLQWDGSNFTDSIHTPQSMDSWLSNGNGFYFFETANGLNPQTAAGVLTGGTNCNPNAGCGSPCGFRGFAYMNAWDVPQGGGCSGTAGYYPQPGEPFRDVGYRLVTETTAGGNTRGDWAKDAAGNYITAGAFDGIFSYQDLDWSNSGNAAGGNASAPAVSPGKNQMFDVCVKRRTFIAESDVAQTQNPQWVPIEYYPGCKPGNNASYAACECSEPHEPYFNLIYNDPDTAVSNSGNGTFNAVTIGWYDPSASPWPGRPKKTSTGLPSGSLVTCASSDVGTVAGQAQCTTNAYDYLGGMCKLQVGVEGVIYNEGGYNATGNAQYFGSVVVGRASDPNGTTRVWYDERLIKGGWPPAGVTFPRVMITSEQVQ